MSNPWDDFKRTDTRKFAPYDQSSADAKQNLDTLSKKYLKPGVRAVDDFGRAVAYQVPQALYELGTIPYNAARNTGLALGQVAEALAAGRIPTREELTQEHVRRMSEAPGAAPHSFVPGREDPSLVGKAFGEATDLGLRGIQGGASTAASIAADEDVKPWVAFRRGFQEEPTQTDQVLAQMAMDAAIAGHSGKGQGPDLGEVNAAIGERGSFSLASLDAMKEAPSEFKATPDVQLKRTPEKVITHPKTGETIKVIPAKEGKIVPGKTATENAMDYMKSKGVKKAELDDLEFEKWANKREFDQKVAYQKAKNAEEIGNMDAAKKFKDEGDKLSLKKEDVEDYVKNNGWETQDYKLGDISLRTAKFDDPVVRDVVTRTNYDTSLMKEGDFVVKGRDVFYKDPDGEFINLESGEVLPQLDDIEEGNYLSTNNDFKYSPQFPEYVERGGKNYTELFVTARKHGNQKNRFFQDDDGYWKYYIPEGRMAGKPVNGKWRTKEEAISAFKEMHQNEPDLLIGDSKIAKYEKWNDGHPQYDDIVNPVVRLRMNERNVDGKKTLFLEEMQGPSEYNQNKMPKSLKDRIYDIGVKRALSYAKENGFEALSWTTGDMQVNRWSSALRKQVDSLSYDLNDGTLTGRKNGGLVIEEKVPEDKLAETVGKDAAEKLLVRNKESTENTISGEDITIDKKWPKKLYGDIEDGEITPSTIATKTKQYGKSPIKIDRLGGEEQKTLRHSVTNNLTVRTERQLNSYMDRAFPDGHLPSDIINVAQDAVDGLLDEDFTPRAKRELADLIEVYGNKIEPKVPTVDITKDTPSTYALYDVAGAITQMIKNDIKQYGKAKTAVKYGVPAAALTSYLLGNDDDKVNLLGSSLAIVPFVGFHGGPKGLNKLSPQQEGLGAIYASKDRFAAEIYAENIDGKVYNVKEDLHNPVYRPARMVDGKRSSMGIDHEEAADLRKQGFDSVIGIDPHTGGIEEVALLKKKGIVPLEVKQQLAKEPLRPAQNRGGTIYAGESGKTHYDKMVVEDGSKAESDNAAGFLTPDGRYLDRKQSLAWLKENDPATFKKLDKTTRENGLESQAYSYAKGIKSDLTNAADSYLRQLRKELGID